MRPDFSESQLQFLVNCEIWFQLLKLGYYQPPIIPSQRQEKNEGYDSGFLIPWLSSATKQGCNFFLQYKRSDLISVRGKFQKYWLNTPYFIFKFESVQHNTLVDLSKLGTTLYVTNSMHQLQELLDLASKMQLCEVLPVLQVSEKIRHFKEVTFNKSHPIFILHGSDAVEPKKNLLSFLDNIRKKQATNINDDILKLIKILIRYEQSKYLTSFTKIIESQISNEDNNNRNSLIISSYLRKYYNIEWFRIDNTILPKNHNHIIPA